MKYSFEFHPYSRKFKQPLVTSHGLWKTREGIILRLKDETGSVGFGEIAPLEWFGSESLQQALEFCNQLPSEITSDDVFAIPKQLPACQFGFESALSEVKFIEKYNKFNLEKIISFSGLLPSGKTALDTWKRLWNQGYRTFKWKIGITNIVEELKVFHSLAYSLPQEAKLRLDANAGLTLPEAVEWLKACDRYAIEFLEQPLPVTELESMLKLSKSYSTRLALDESIANIDQLKACYKKGWQGIFVIKPAIAGSPKLLREFCKNQKIDAVFSSVFETRIGTSAGLKLATELNKNNLAAGFGVTHWFSKEDFLSSPDTHTFRPYEPCKPIFQELWTKLSKLSNT
ncbi:MAG: o-succinylbenzoate synthase [Scytonematopsis contorta HA4267-MV1]|jgi:O-succinylbenzoate synthase|nr:o-succinylbenzoate synthase [Scytonematopsis contorta HA4267-MV1]